MKLILFFRKEINKIRATSYIRGVLTSYIMFTTRICLFASILAYVLVHNVITAKQVFVVTSFYNILRQTMTVFFPQGERFSWDDEWKVVILRSFVNAGYVTTIALNGYQIINIVGD